MTETLLSISSVLLYGRVLEDLTFRFKKPSDAVPDAKDDKVEEPPRLGNNRFLQDQLAGKEPRIARIYAFSYEGHYYDLARPSLFLVHGPGVQADTPARDPRAAKAPDKTNKFGVAATAKSFPEDMRVWAYDKGDFSVRLDVETGTLERILLESEMASEKLKTYFGASKLRLRSPGGDGED